jgi:Cdc6-like AAA superfamily ATPase
VIFRTGVWIHHHSRPILTLLSLQSISLLPATPKIFRGREAELSAILQLFRTETPRIAILGAGGMGKTSLSKAVLHHPEMASRYDQHRVFVSCDTLSNSIQLASLIGAHIGLKPGKDLTQAVLHHFSIGPPTLLVLDNLETIWEPEESRAHVEKFMCHLTDVEQLAISVSTEPMHSSG